MTYREFRKWCHDNGYYTKDSLHRLRVMESGHRHIQIKKNKVEQVILSTADISLIEKALELAKTPLEEREEQKRYYVVLKGVNQNFGYVNEDEDTGVLFMNGKRETDCEKTKFTKAEAEEIMKKLSFEMVEVEDE